MEVSSNIKSSIEQLNALLHSKELDANEINQVLDKLNSDFFISNTLKDELQKSVNSCCRSISSQNSLLVAKSSNFIFNVIANNMYDSDPSIIVRWICDSLDNCADIAYMDLLQLTDALTKVSRSNFSKDWSQLFSILIKKLELNANVSSPNVIKLNRINTLKNLSGILPEDYHLTLAKEYLDILYTQGTNDLVYHSQICMSIFEALDLLCTLSTNWLNTTLNEVISIILYGIELGLNGKHTPIPKSVYRSVVAVPPPGNNVETTKINLKIKRKQKNKVKQVGWSEQQVINVENDEDNCSNYEYFNTSLVTSESDVSDNEGNQLARLSKAQAKARHSAFNLLIQIVKVLGCKALYEYYGIILGKLTVCVKKEKLSKPKIASMAAINALLIGAKTFLAQAQHSEKGTFTAFSEVLSELISGLHSTFGGVLVTMPHMSIVIPLLHTTSSLISVTPYHRLKPELLSNLFKTVYLYINHKDPTVCVGVLHCLSEIVILTPVTNEQKEVIKYGINDGTNADGTWLLSHCFNLLKEQTSSDVRVACWQILGGLCQCHFELITNSFSTLENYIFQDLNAPNKPMIYAAKTLEHLLSKLLLQDEFENYRKDLWMKLLQGPFVSLIENSRRAAAIACDCLSNIGPQVFNSLKEETQILIITLLYGCCYSEVVVVRGSAINALGVFLMYSQITHEQFVHDTKDILIKSLSDESDYVRTKAAWAFGNLVDLLFENQDKEFVHEISVIKLLEAALLVINDNYRVKANILRAVGNLLLLVNEEQLNNPDCKELVEKAVNFCMFSSNNGSLMKMRWNACYAIGTFLQNDALYKFSNKWLAALINSLCNLLVKCNNFKVRANACAALCSIKKREYFGVYYHHVWSSLLDGLENAANMPDFKEFKHQDHLIQQLCCAVCHLTSILEIGDVSELNDIMCYRLEPLQQRMLQFQNSAPPEKSGTIVNALNNVKKWLIYIKTFLKESHSIQKF
ncbi:hypothetical protein O3M35_010294 [Rhynocoris fuscipes]|uniref:HEAT repeat-containing protein 6 n=1 Tax=Rhynocoris fuscipes TaxID=488301 RepID=A0AAW1D4J4_9HEMI